MPKANEQRHFTRIPFDAEISLTDPGTGQAWRSQLLDISLKGALINRPSEWNGDLEHAYELELHLPGAGESIRLRMEVRVAHCNRQHIGLHCEHMDLDTATHLHRLVELNLGDEKLLERELNELVSQTKS